MITKKIIKDLEEYLLQKAITVNSDNIVFGANNMEDINVCIGTYTIFFLNWGRIKTELKWEGYFYEDFYTDLEDYYANIKERK